ncbi:transcriptional regulator ATRX [Mycetomoellerius zeteki]|uniref:transcriptional regulator ATRX n=1 Tax=Mycetomoellerius zeteki TaxID=64791 RepID=UPI00084EA1DC|nr:PREDICTED: transcriptional regulator ATRX [Trachymyrmex zeteki]
MSKCKNSIGNNKEYSSASSYTSSSLSSDEEEIDARDLKPIREYLSDRKVLARQLFISVKPEKIRLMLPQVLKHMDLSELEEWCESELNGMSKARILSILNGKPMLESSDTSEDSDDSGPSLEIISDTEEWLTDDDISKKENGAKGKLKKDKTKIKGKAQVNKKSNVNKLNIKTKSNIKVESNDKIENIKIKKENDKDKGKEGDSLLDLLELEMRARAIRALIRKEEDIIPSNSSQKNDTQATENNISTSQDDKAKENYRKQLERIISSQQSIKGEDEDVVLVIPNPAPVVELLSSDSDREETRVSKELQNDVSKAGKSVNNSDENSINISSQDLKERKENEGIIEINSTNTKSHLTNTSEAIMPERNVDIKNNILSISISADNVAERRKKSKKKSRGKLQLASTITNSSESTQINVTEINEESSDKSIKSKLNPDENEIIIDEGDETKQKVTEESKVEEERSTDIDDIDLDDYCEVMEIDNSDEDKSQEKIVSSQQENEQSVFETTLSKSDSAETWASRYYQTDDVQNVIKESKIQSEIRKRLRERQRLSKQNKSPNLSAQPSATDATVAFETAPTGSVEEYLALKRAMSTSNSNSDDTIMEVQCTSNVNNDTMENNPVVINSNSDIETKEILEQDENNSSQECTDNNAQKTAISEVVIAKSAETVADTNNDAQSN